MTAKALVAQLHDVAKLGQGFSPEQYILTGIVMGLESYRNKLRGGCLGAEDYFEDRMRTAKRASNLLAKEGP